MQKSADVCIGNIAGVQSDLVVEFLSLCKLEAPY